MKRTRKVKKVEEIRASLEEVNYQSEEHTSRCSTGWPQNSTVRIFKDICDAFDYGIELKRKGKLLPTSCNVSIFERKPCLTYSHPLQENPLQAGYKYRDGATEEKLRRDDDVMLEP